MEWMALEFYCVRPAWLRPALAPNPFESHCSKLRQVERSSMFWQEVPAWCSLLLPTLPRFLCDVFKYDRLLHPHCYRCLSDCDGIWMVVAHQAAGGTVADCGEDLAAAGREFTQEDRGVGGGSD